MKTMNNLVMVAYNLGSDRDEAVLLHAIKIKGPCTQLLPFIYLVRTDKTVKQIKGELKMCIDPIKDRLIVVDVTRSVIEHSGLRLQVLSQIDNIS